MRNPYLNAVLAALYIIGIVLLIQAFSSNKFFQDTILIPIVMLCLLVFSVALMGFLIIYKPLTLYLDGAKQEAVTFFFKTVATFALFTIIFAGTLLYQIKKPVVSKSVVFTCDAGKAIAATFYLSDDKQVDLILSDGRKLSVPRAVSASGARYANKDESFVFWNKGNTAFITESGSETYSGCVLPTD